MNQELQAVIEKEGNYKQFTHEGFTCFIRCGPMGALNGYVIVEQGHRYFGKDYHFINANANVDVHKGLTFSETATATDGSNKKVHVIGFDCSHFTDIMPFSPIKYNWNMLTMNHLK